MIKNDFINLHLQNMSTLILDCISNQIPFVIAAAYDKIGTTTTFNNPNPTNPVVSISLVEWSLETSTLNKNVLTFSSGVDNKNNTEECHFTINLEDIVQIESKQDNYTLAYVNAAYGLVRDINIVKPPLNLTGEEYSMWKLSQYPGNAKWFKPAETDITDDPGVI